MKCLQRKKIGATLATIIVGEKNTLAMATRLLLRPTLVLSLLGLG
jgi:hypothetical protein